MAEVNEKKPCHCSDVPKKMLGSIRDLPMPVDISGIRTLNVQNVTSTTRHLIKTGIGDDPTYEEAEERAEENSNSAGDQDT